MKYKTNYQLTLKKLKMRKLNLKLALMLFAIFIGTSTIAQTWNITGNALSANGILGGTSGNYDILFQRQGVSSGIISVYNTGFGYVSLVHNNPTGGGLGNTAHGVSTLASNTIGSNNVAIGHQALYSNTLSIYNTAVGWGSLYYFNPTSTNTGGNTAVGASALGLDTVGTNNTAIGQLSLFNNLGTSNTAIGFESLATNTSGTYNTAVGTSADVSSGSLTGATAIGAHALVSQNYSIALGGAVGSGWATNVGIGTATPHNSLEIVSATSGTSGLRLTNLTSVTATPPTSNVLSLDASNNLILVAPTTIPTGPTNGNFWGLTGNSGTNPTTNFIGTTDNVNVIFKVNNIQSGLLDNANFNTSWGVTALNPSSTGEQNTVMGYGALTANTTGGSNTAMGYGSLVTNTSGFQNISIGSFALRYNVGGAYNVAVGSGALDNNNSGQYNVGIGFGAEGVNQTGTDNVGIGSAAGVSVDGLTNTVAIGAGAQVGISDQIILGNTSVTSIKAGTGYVIYSDGRFKKNIKQNVPGLAFIKQLKPVTYNYDIHGLNKHIQPNAKPDSGESQNIKEAGINAKEKIVYTGFVAQDVETAANNIGYDFSGLYKPQNDLDTYGLSYSDFVPSLVKADQELSEQNDSLQNTVNNLQQQLNDIKTTINQMQTAMSQCCNSYSSTMTAAAKPQLISGTDIPNLQQNTPNPYNGSTVIGYHLPQSTTNAEIIVTDLTGNVIRSISLNGTGNGQITFSSGSLESGTYFYTLLVNGQKIDTKEMIIAN